MAELDYAYLTDFAQVMEGKLSTIGASYTHVMVPDLPAVFSTTVAGRIRARADEGSVPISIKIVPPNNDYEFEAGGSIAAGPNLRPYDGKVGLLFTFSTEIPIQSTGLYEVFIFIDGVQVRRLAFDVETAPER